MLLELPNGARQKRINLAEFDDESANLSKTSSKATGIYSSIDYPTTNEDTDTDVYFQIFTLILHDFLLIFVSLFFALFFLHQNTSSNLEKSIYSISMSIRCT